MFYLKRLEGLLLWLYAIARLTFAISLFICGFSCSSVCPLCDSRSTACWQTCFLVPSASAPQSSDRFNRCIRSIKFAFEHDCSHWGPRSSTGSAAPPLFPVLFPALFPAQLWLLPVCFPLVQVRLPPFVPTYTSVTSHDTSVSVRSFSPVAAVHLVPPLQLSQLANYLDQAAAAGLQDSFHIGFEASSISLQSASSNMSSAFDNPPVILP